MKFRTSFPLPQSRILLAFGVEVLCHMFPSTITSLVTSSDIIAIVTEIF